MIQLQRIKLYNNIKLLYWFHLYYGLRGSFNYFVGCRGVVKSDQHILIVFLFRNCFVYFHSLKPFVGVNCISSFNDLAVCVCNKVLNRLSFNLKNRTTHPKETIFWILVAFFFNLNFLKTILETFDEEILKSRFLRDF